MSYVKTVWTDRYVETPNTYTMTENQDNTVTLTESTGTVYTEGTPVSAANMNKIEDKLYELDARDRVTIYEGILAPTNSVQYDFSPYKELIIHYSLYANTATNTGGQSNIKLLDLSDTPTIGSHITFEHGSYISGDTVQVNSFITKFEVDALKSAFTYNVWYGGTKQTADAAASGYYVYKIEGIK